MTQPNENQWRSIGLRHGLLLNVFPITTDWNAKFGALVAGKKVFVRVRILTPEGFAGEWQTAVTIVA